MSKSAIGVLGVVMILLGAISLLWGYFTYSDRETVLAVGDVEIQAETRERVTIPPLVGGLVLAGGIVLLVASGRKGPA